MPVLLKTMQIHKFWRRITTTRRARTLEAELALERAVIAGSSGDRPTGRRN